MLWWWKSLISMLNMLNVCQWCWWICSLDVFGALFRCFLLFFDVLSVQKWLRWLEFLEVSQSSTNLTSTVTTCQELLRFQEERRIAAMVKLAERDRQDRQARCSSLGSVRGKSYGVLPYLGLMNIHLYPFIIIYHVYDKCATYTVGMNKRVQYQLFDSYPDDFRWSWFFLVVFLNKMKGKVSRISDKITEFECLLRAHLESWDWTKGFSIWRLWSVQDFSIRFKIPIKTYESFFQGMSRPEPKRMVLD